MAMNGGIMGCVDNAEGFRVDLPEEENSLFMTPTYSASAPPTICLCVHLLAMKGPHDSYSVDKTVTVQMCLFMYVTSVAL